jgi:hypothetical protein
MTENFEEWVQHFLKRESNGLMKFSSKNEHFLFVTHLKDHLLENLKDYLRYLYEEEGRGYKKVKNEIHNKIWLQSPRSLRDNLDNSFTYLEFIEELFRFH